MKTSKPFLLLLVALSAGCSGSGDAHNATDILPATQSPPPRESTEPVGAIVVYAEDDATVNAVPAAGGEPVAIAGNATYRGATQDGRIILLQGEALLSVRVADGSVHVLDDAPGTKLFRDVFDANYVVYERHTREASSVHVVRGDGTGAAVPVPARPQPLQFIAVTPSHRVLYWTCDRARTGEVLDCIDPRLLSVALDGSDERLVLSGTPSIRHITADDLLVYERSTVMGTAVSVVRSDGTGSRILVEAESFFAGVLPNGRIVYNRREYGQFDLYSIAPDGTAARALATSDEDEFYAGTAPDGRVLFRRGPPGQQRLYSVDETTGDIRTLQVAGDSMVRAVAPNGTVIVSSRFGTGDQAQDNLYSVRADGTELRALADSSDMEWFEALAPDGRVIYRRCIPAPSGPCGNPSAQSDIYSVEQDATGATALATSPAFEVVEGVTQDNRVVYRRFTADQSDLYGIPTVGGPAQPLANTASDERFIAIIESGSAGENPG